MHKYSSLSRKLCERMNYPTGIFATTCLVDKQADGTAFWLIRLCSWNRSFREVRQKKSLWRNPKIFRFVDERSSCRTESPRYVIVKKLKKFIAFFPLQIHIGPHSIECWEYSRFTDVPLGSSVDLCLRKKNPQSNCELKSENGLYPNVCNFYNV